MHHKMHIVGEIVPNTWLDIYNYFDLSIDIIESTYFIDANALHLFWLKMVSMPEYLLIQDTVH